MKHFLLPVFYRSQCTPFLLEGDFERERTQHFCIDKIKGLLPNKMDVKIHSIQIFTVNPIKRVHEMNECTWKIIELHLRVFSSLNFEKWCALVGAWTRQPVLASRRFRFLFWELCESCELARARPGPRQLQCLLPMQPQSHCVKYSVCM